MAESIITDVCRESNGDEGFGALEQQVSIDDSCEFHPNFAAGGLESTLNHLSKWLLIVFFYTVILLRHDTKALWLVLGDYLNGGLSISLKHILKQERPFSTFNSDPGMPSSHAQSIFFSVFVANLSIMEWLGVNGLATTLTGFLLALGSYFSWLRVSQQFHTVSQVVVGALVGSMFAILWFWLWEAIVLKAFISYLWVRFSVVFGASVISLGFTLYIFRYWVMDEK